METSANSFAETGASRVTAPATASDARPAAQADNGGNAAAADGDNASGEKGLRPRSVGDILRSTREEYGENLRGISATLRINWAYLDALERDEHDRLPGRAYVTGFIRSYAQYLGLDPQPLLDQLREDAAGRGGEPLAPQKLVFPEPVREARRPGMIFIVLSLLVAALGYGGYTMISGDPDEAATDSTATSAPPASGGSPVRPGNAAPEQPTQRTATQQAAPAGQVPPIQPSAAPAAAPGAAVTSAPPALPPLAPVASVPVQPGLSAGGEGPRSVTALAPIAQLQLMRPDAPQTLPPVGVAPSLAPVAPPSPAPAASTPAATAPATPALGPDGQPLPPGETPPAEPREPQVYFPNNGDARIIVTAEKDSWVEIADSTGRRIFSRVMLPGDMIRVPNEGNLRLRTGNAGGLQFVVDGREAPPVGPSGSVRSNIRLDPEMLLTGTAYTPPAPRPEVKSPETRASDGAPESGGSAEPGSTPRPPAASDN